MKPLVRIAAFAATLGALSSLPPATAADARLPIFDAHVHYSHDAWESTPAVPTWPSATITPPTAGSTPPGEKPSWNFPTAS